jgi:uncharacterized integral membrane protein
LSPSNDPNTLSRLIRRADQRVAIDAGHVFCAADHGKANIMAQRSLGDTTSGAAERRALRLSGGAIASLTGVGALGVFMIQNTDDVTAEFLFWDFTCPLWLLVLVSALVGALVWLGLGVLRRHRRRTARREARRD